jgi:hypothetical protein
MGNSEIPKQPQPIAFTREYLLTALPQECPCDESVILDQVLPDIVNQRCAQYTMEAVLNGLDKMHQDEASISIRARCKGPRRSFILKRPIGCGLETTVQIRTEFSNQNPEQ